MHNTEEYWIKIIIDQLERVKEHTLEKGANPDFDSKLHELLEVYEDLDRLLSKWEY